MRPKGDLANKVIMTIAVVCPFIGLLVAIYFAWNRYVFTSDLILFASLSFILGMGVTIGYHRMLTHQGFDAPSWVRAIFLILGSMALVGSKPDEWAATHIRHHAHSDEEGDPHSPLEGFWHAHFGWLFSLDNFSYAEEYAPQLLNDPVVMFVNRWSWAWTILPFLIPFAIGGWTGLLWGGVVRMFWTTHVTWSVNSICHTFGRRDFETTDESRNEWVIGLLAFGEGWHNNHHAFPRNAFHGMWWWQFDASGLIISALEKLGLVWNVQRVTEEGMAAQRSHAQKLQEAVERLRGELTTSLTLARNELTTVWDRLVHASSVPESQHAEWKQAHDSAVNRLEEIRSALDRSVHLKRQKIMLYKGEVDRIVATARGTMAQFAPQSVA
jgi:stearoyl-CoA desaturase (delta-9 desaturase)